MLLRETPSSRATTLTFSPASIRRKASSLNSRLNRLGSLVLNQSSPREGELSPFSLSQARGSLQICYRCVRAGQNVLERRGRDSNIAHKILYEHAFLLNYQLGPRLGPRVGGGYESPSKCRGRSAEISVVQAPAELRSPRRKSILNQAS